MNPLRDRAKQQFPTVLLTLLSIVQALSLELWWQFVSDLPLAVPEDLPTLTLYLQTGITFWCIITVWLVYASTSMRFRWVPATADSVYPFVVGLVQFMLIESLYAERRGLWLIDIGLVFLSMVLILQFTMRRARKDPDNRLFFAVLEPATLRDMVPHMLIAVFFIGSGIASFKGDYQRLAMFATIAAFALLVFQFTMARRFWRSSMEAEEEDLDEMLTEDSAG